MGWIKQKKKKEENIDRSDWYITKLPGKLQPRVTTTTVTTVHIFFISGEERGGRLIGKMGIMQEKRAGDGSVAGYLYWEQMLLLEGQGGQIILSILITLETNHQRPEAKVRWMSSWGSKATFLFTLKLHQHRIPKQIKTPATIKQVNPKTQLSFLLCETSEPDVITSAWMSQVSALTFKIYSLERKR